MLAGALVFAAAPLSSRQVPSLRPWLEHAQRISVLPSTTRHAPERCPPEDYDLCARTRTTAYAAGEGRFVVAQWKTWVVLEGPNLGNELHPASALAQLRWVDAPTAEGAIEAVGSVPRDTSTWPSARPRFEHHVFVYDTNGTPPDTNIAIVGDRAVMFSPIFENDALLLDRGFTHAIDTGLQQDRPPEGWRQPAEIGAFVYASDGIIAVPNQQWNGVSLLLTGLEPSYRSSYFQRLILRREPQAFGALGLLATALALAIWGSVRLRRMRRAELKAGREIAELLDVAPDNTVNIGERSARVVEGAGHSAPSSGPRSVLPEASQPTLSESTSYRTPIERTIVARTTYEGAPTEVVFLLEKKRLAFRSAILLGAAALIAAARIVLFDLFQ